MFRFGCASVLSAIALFGFASRAQLALKSPNVSANALMLFRHSNFHKENADEVRNGFDIQEAEIDLYSDVDPYTRLFMVFSAEPQYEAGDVPGTTKETWEFSPEELYAESNYVPGLTIRAGKFKAAFGKHNQLHTHAFPFTEAPIANTVLLGDEGLNDTGVSVSAMVPGVPWYSELIGQWLRGGDQNPEFNSPTPGDAVWLGRWKNLFDLSDSLTMELGGSLANGNNSVGGVTNLRGADVTFKWRPTEGGKYHSAIVAFEYIGRDRSQASAPHEHGDGLTSWAKYQFAERWSGLVRYETLDVNGSQDAKDLPNIMTTKSCYSVVFAATEFSAFRLEFDHAHGPTNLQGDRNEDEVFVQANFTIGAHPAHAY